MRSPLIFAAFFTPIVLLAQQPTPSTGEPWRIVPQPQSTLVFARDGSLVGEIGKEWRTSVSIRTLPKYVPQAFIAVEDHRFYQHDGVDVIGVLGALKDNVMGEHPRGASTITQQLVGNMHPDVVDRRDKGIGRKLREQSAAREMEKHYNKDQILEAFLNQISFGHNWYGIESAARHYFGKPASRLTIAEAASLASLPKSPVGYDPAAHPANNRRRRNTVLALMAQQDFITAEQAREAEAEPVVTAPYAGMAASAPWFVDAVKTQAERAGVPVSSGGYRIYTTIDVPLQRAAVAALAEGIAAVESRPGYKHPVPGKAGGPSSVPASQLLQGAVIAIDPATGDVRALVGGRDYARGPFNRAVNGVRQPGSSFKPFVYAAAVAESIPPNAIIPDTALAITLDNGTVYKPDNSDRQFLGPITMREALTKSRNPVAVQLGLQVGIDTIAALARGLGITSAIARFPSSAIGASAVRPIDLVTAYTGFANLGAAVEPRFVLRIDDHTGHPVWNARPAARDSALDQRVAFIVRDMMRDVVERGTANPVRRYVPATVPVAGKTGTTNDNTDVWFVGMTPDLVAGVWLGFDTPKMITAGAAGGSLAAPIWGRMIESAPPPRGGASWATPPDGIVTMELDRATGQPSDLTTPNERRYTEYFLDGTQPGAPKVDVWRLFRVGPIGL